MGVSGTMRSMPSLPAPPEMPTEVRIIIDAIGHSVRTEILRQLSERPLGVHESAEATGTKETAARKHLAIATYNVENLSPKDPQSKFDALAQGVVHNLAAPDIVAVEEVQDNDGATDDGVVSANQTLTELTDAISAAGGPCSSTSRWCHTSSTQAR